MIRNHLTFMHRFLDALNFMFAISCDKATRLMSDSMERKLTFVERFALVGHLLACKTSRRFRRQMKSLRQELHQGFDEADTDRSDNSRLAFHLSTRARERIRAELQQTAAND